MTFFNLMSLSLSRIVRQATWLGLPCLIAIGGLSACNFGTAATPIPTATTAPTPTPTQLPDELILDVSLVMPNPKRDKEGSWADLIEGLTYTRANASGSQYTFAMRDDSEMLSQLSGDRDMIVWIIEGGYSFKPFDNFFGTRMLQYAESQSRELFRHSAELLEWVSAGGVFVFQGNVHPVGFPQDAMPYAVESQERRENDCRPSCRLSLTRAGRLALAAERGWPLGVSPAYTDMSDRNDYIATYQNLAGAWEVWGVIAGQPAIVAAKYGDGWVILSQLSHDDTNSEYALGLLRAALFRTTGSPTEMLRPIRVTDDAIQDVAQIAREAEEGRLTELQAQAQLNQVAREVGIDALYWIVAHTPVLDLDTGEVTLFEEYAKDLAATTGSESPSRLEEDPIGTTMDLMFNRPDSETIGEWLGVDQ